MFKINAIGSDPEFILLDKNNNPVSAIGIDNSENNVSIYADNVLVEFSHEPFKPEHFAQGMKGVMAEVESLVANHKEGYHFKVGQCAAHFSNEQLDCPEAHEIGCNPFMSAYDVTAYQVPKPYETNDRFAGGHIHIAYDKESFPPHMLVQLLDEKLLPLDPNHNKTLRSSFYGAKGSFRLKDYGLEYRAVSNWWLDEPQLVVDILQEIETFVNKKYYGA